MEWSKNVQTAGAFYDKLLFCVALQLIICVIE